MTGVSVISFDHNYVKCETNSQSNAARKGDRQKFLGLRSVARAT